MDNDSKSAEQYAELHNSKKIPSATRHFNIQDELIEKLEEEDLENCFYATYIESIIEETTQD